MRDGGYARVLLTGSTGMVGRNFVRWMTTVLKDRPHITCLGRRPSESEHVKNIIVGEFAESTLEEALNGLTFDIVFHLAAAGVHPSSRDPDELHRVNVELPVALVRVGAAHQAKVVVLAGSSAEYAASIAGVRLAENATLEGTKIYGLSKARGAEQAMAVSRQCGVTVITGRIFNVYGPGEAAHRLMPSLVVKLNAGQPVPLSPGAQLRDFIYVDDVCDALWQLGQVAFHHALPSEPYNICTGTARSVKDFAQLVARSGHYSEDLLRFGALPMRPDDVPYLVGNPDKLASALHWRATYDLAAGIKATFDSEVRRRQL